MKSIQRKIHSHDVNALVICAKKLYSGGADGYLACCFHPPKTLLKMPPTLQPPFVCLSKETRSILLRYPKHIELWSLGQDDQKSDNSFQGWLPLKDKPKKLLVLYRSKKDMEGEEEKEGIICSSISSDSSWIVYSTCSGVRLIKVQRVRFTFNFFMLPFLVEIFLISLKVTVIFLYIFKEQSSIKVEKLHGIENFETPCLLANFTIDSASLIIAPEDGGLLVYDLTDEKPCLSQKLETNGKCNCHLLLERVGLDSMNPILLLVLQSSLLISNTQCVFS